MNKIYVGDFGTEFLLDTGVDITSATTVEIHFEKPNETIGKWVGVVKNKTKIQYITKQGDLNQEGQWKLQAYVVFSSGTWRGEVATFKIYGHFK